MSDDEEEEEQENLSDNDDDDDGLHADIEALRQACLLTRTEFNNNNGGATNMINTRTPSPPQEPKINGSNSYSESESNGHDDGEEEDDDDVVNDDLEYVRNIRDRLSLAVVPLSPKPVILPPGVDYPDDDDDDFETLRSVQQRFGAPEPDDFRGKDADKSAMGLGQIDLSNDASEFNDSFFGETGASSEFLDLDDFGNLESFLGDKQVIETCVNTNENWYDARAILAVEHDASSLSNSIQEFDDAVKKNRSLQKLLWEKLGAIESAIAENKKLMARLEVFKKLQTHIKRKMTLELGLRKDPRVKLISPQRTSDSEGSEAGKKKGYASLSGPMENCNVAKYRMALSRFPLLFKQRDWSEADKKNLVKGVRQQIQELLLTSLMDRFSDPEGFPGDSLDNIFTLVKNLDITPEMIRKFLPKVDWEQVVKNYVPSHSAAECEARWLNYEDPLINHTPWTSEEDKNLSLIVQENWESNWKDKAESLGSNRTAYQCLQRYQRSLNTRMLKSEWTKEEDARLCAAVEAFGEHDWQSVASSMEGRTGSQCSNRWNKSLCPKRKGGWTRDEVKRLKVAVKIFGPKNWNKIAQFVPGRSQAQCRERWFNVSDPSRNLEKWTEEEDLKLKAAYDQYGNRWSKIAKCLPSRTDNECLRRWRILFPSEALLLEATRKVKKAALVRNFVDRESEKPALDPIDILPLRTISSMLEPPNVQPPNKRNIKSRCNKVGDKSNKRPPRPQVCRKVSDRKMNESLNSPTFSRSPGFTASITNDVEVPHLDGGTCSKKSDVPVQCYSRRRSKITSSSDSVLETAGEEDITLACLLHKKRKKRGAETTTNNKETVTQIPQLHEEEIMPVPTGDGEQLIDECRTSGMHQSCEMGSQFSQLANCMAVDPHESITECVSFNQGGDSEEDGVSLADLFRDKKKRRVFADSVALHPCYTEKIDQNEC